MVSGCFVVALVVAGVVARNRLAVSLERSAITTAESVLIDTVVNELQPVNGPIEVQAALSGVTRLTIADIDGNGVSQTDFEAILDEAAAQSFAELGFFVDGPTELGPDVVVINEGFPGSVDVPFEFPPNLAIVGEPSSMRTVDTIRVAQEVAVGDAVFQLAVVTPTKPLDDSLAAFTLMGLILIPVMGALVAIATWLTTSRVIRPVEDIRLQVERTDPRSLDHHVPRSHNGDEIDRLAGTMNDMLDRLHVSSHRQRQFVSDASHELRSPITATIATLETTTPDDAANNWPEVSGTILNEQLRLADLVDDLLLLASSDEAGDVRRPVDDVDLDDVVLAVASRPLPKPVKVQIIHPQRVPGNRSLLERCVGNLVENAARHAESQVWATVTTNEAGNPVVWIDDDGPGVPPDRMEHIFERFTRLDDARNRRRGGAGLGLSIARTIAEQHDAELSVGSRNAGGARFELTFPNQCPELDAAPTGGS